MQLNNNSSKYTIRWKIANTEEIINNGTVQNGIQQEMEGNVETSVTIKV